MIVRELRQLTRKKLAKISEQRNKKISENSRKFADKEIKKLAKIRGQRNKEIHRQKIDYGSTIQRRSL